MRWRYWLGRAVLRCSGWRAEGGGIPPRCVVIAAPHTSNWDLIFTLAVAFALEVPLQWLGKHTLFRVPFGGFFRWLGGVPVDRRSPHGLVAQVVAEYGRRERFQLAVPPEGTRAKVSYWKSGFYHIAAGAKVPIVLGYLDFARKVGGLGPAILPSGDLHADMEQIRAFYQDKRGKHPERESVPRLREESAAA